MIISLKFKNTMQSKIIKQPFKCQMQQCEANDFVSGIAY